MKVSNETGIQFGTSEYIKTDVSTDNFYLKIITGKGHFTTKKVFRPIATTFSIGTIYTGDYWDSYEEALEEGKILIQKAQTDFDEEMEWKNIDYK